MSTQQLKGSESRDHFKYLHKQKLDSDCYALDSDLELVAKNPEPFIVARLDFKLEGDKISFSEVIAYNQLIEATPVIPVYVIEAQKPFVDENCDNHTFAVKKYLGGDHRPYPEPEYDLQPLYEGLGWEGLNCWERLIRCDRIESLR